MTTYFRYLTINFPLHTGIKEPAMTDGDRFYKVYSPEKFKLRLRDDIYLDLKFNIETPETLEPLVKFITIIEGIGVG